MCNAGVRWVKHYSFKGGGKILDSFWKPHVHHSSGTQQVLNKYLLVDSGRIITSRHVPKC